MIQGLENHLFRIPVSAGEIVEVFDHGQRLRVQTCEDFNGPRRVEIALSRGTAMLKRPKLGDILVQYPQGNIDVMDPADFAAKAACGGADVS